MVDIGKLIVSLREERSLTQKQLATQLGVTKQTVSNYERGIRRPEYETLEALADIFNVPIGFFISEQERNSELERIRRRESEELITPLTESAIRRIPLLGTAACGDPVYDEVIGVYISTDMAKADYAMKVDGDSMAPTFLDGDLVYLREQPDVEDGQIGAIQTEDGWRLKHIHHLNGGLLLTSDNAKYPPVIVSPDQHPRILGLAIGFTRAI